MAVDRPRVVTEATTQPRCLFCNTASGKRTKELIWRAALRGRFGGAQSLTFVEQTEGRESYVKRPGSQFDMVLKAVCADCNSGWLNELEDDALPVLDHYGLLVGPEPTRVQLENFAFWAAVRALLRTHYSPAGHAPKSLFRSMYERRFTRRLPDGCLVSIANTLPVYMEAGMHQSGRFEGHYLGHVAVSWGSLFISIVIADPCSTTTSLARRAVDRQRRWFPGALCRLAPATELPSRHARVLLPSQTYVAGALLGILLGLEVKTQFGNPIYLDGVVPRDRQGQVPWPEVAIHE